MSSPEAISNLEQVIWLLIAFGWGVVRIVWDLSQEGSLVGHWTFGQVVAVVLLAAPFITMMQYFNKGMHLCSRPPPPT